MKKYSLLLVCLTFTLLAMSQKPVITYEKNAHDFGKVNEEDGKITYVFDFKNAGATPLVINRVQASCGCTTPTWTKEPIEPGKKGSITVTYNPSGRPGPFTKTITVYSNASEEQTILTIKGEVIPKPTSDNGGFPINMGGIGIKFKVIQMNNVDKGKVQTRVIDIENTTKASVKPIIENLPPYITVSIVPETLKPNEAGKVTFTFNSKTCTQWGPISDDVFLLVNGQKKMSEENKLTIVANVIEDFSKITLDQKRNSPILEMSARSVNLGQLKVGSKRKVKFQLSNKGQNTLEIRRVINNNKDLYVHPFKLSVGSGKSESIVLDLDTKNLAEDKYTRSITVQTNDPDNSFVLLSLTWKTQK
jgi:hypothetical protein